LPTPIPVGPDAGHTIRAKRFFEEFAGDGIFVGLAVGDPWTDEAAPPTALETDRNLGRITVTGSPGASLTSDNCKCEFNLECFQAGIESYKIVAASASTYNVIKVSDSSVLASAVAVSANGNDSVVKGLTFTVTSTSMTTGHEKIFKIDGPIAFKKVEEIKYVVEDEDGEIEYAGGNWTEVDAADIFTQRVRHVWVKAVFRYAEHPAVDWRQSGVLTRLVRVTGNANALLPSEVDESGWLELVVNDTQLTRNAISKEELCYILEF
jgi:hypothetical protein